jgi:hypothetical protein
MRTTVLLAMLPLALAGTLLPEPRSPYTGPRQSPIAAHADSFRERFEAVYPTHTFAQRWWPGDGVTFDQRWAPVELPGPVRVRTIQITKPPPEPPQEAVAAINTAVPLPEPRPTVQAKPRPIRVANICEKHGLRKVETGRTWRCRR